MTKPRPLPDPTPAPARPPAMVALAIGARLLEEDGRLVELSAADALRRLAERPHLLCHAEHLIARLALSAPGARALSEQARRPAHFDVAELFAFARPASLAPPLPARIAAAVGLAAGDGDPAALGSIAEALLARLASSECPHPLQAHELANFLRGNRWPWAERVLAALESGRRFDAAQGFARSGLEIWERLPEWEEPGPQPPPGQRPVTAEAARARLRAALGAAAEPRPEQHHYAATVAAAFAPRPSRHENTILLAEAGTGLGKTLGYLAPAAVWAEQNAGPVWVSTYTRNLQRQLLAETRRLWPDAAEHRRRVVVRKGRENHLCLLNAQERLAAFSAGGGKGAVLAALIARWALASADGDMVGGDFPAWLMGLLLPERAAAPLSPMALGLTDRRGECTHNACPHFRKCFIEKARARARRAEIVIANHAVVMTSAAMEVMLGDTGPGQAQDAEFARLVFDEGHHLFDAADAAFSGHLTALEMRELRRWIRGPEDGRRRGRSLRERLSDLIEATEDGAALLAAVEEAARHLPGAGWPRRLRHGEPHGPAEAFLLGVREQVLARARGRKGVGELEADCHPLAEGNGPAAEMLGARLHELETAMTRLAATLHRRLAAEAETLSDQDRNRIEALARSLRRRGALLIGGWRGMLERLLAAQEDDADDPRFAEWFSIDYRNGAEIDVGMHAHWVDPTAPLAATVLKPADSVIITSATLRDRPPDAPDDWRSAETRTGAAHLPWPVKRLSLDSPFDYARNAKVLVITNVARDDAEQVAAAFRALFLAAGGGALGLFTAIARLRAVHERLLPVLAEAGLPLYAQHVDPMDVGTLIDIFRAQTDACLLGTDAVRDGIDVPGRALRLMVMDRVPWPRPTILERARKAAFGGAVWTDMMVRLKLRQAFGRLIRKADDRGVFVMLDPRLGQRFHTAFPDGVEVTRIGLADAVRLVREFLK